MPAITPDLVTFLRSHFVLDWHGLHGANHWARVKLNGLLLAAETGADAHVVELFAFLHDSCREDDGRDYTHGSRSAELVGVLRDEQLIRVSDTQHEWLVDACRRHSDGELAAAPASDRRAHPLSLTVGCSPRFARGRVSSGARRS